MWEGGKIDKYNFNILNGMQKYSISVWSPESVQKILLFLRILLANLTCGVLEAMNHFCTFISISNENSNLLWLVKISPSRFPLEFVSVQTSSAIGNDYFLPLQTKESVSSRTTTRDDSWNFFLLHFPSTGTLW